MFVRSAWSPRTLAGLMLGLPLLLVMACGHAVGQNARSGNNVQPAQPSQAPRDTVADAQTPVQQPTTRPEQRTSDHDRSDMFSATKTAPSSTTFAQQPDQGKV